MATLWTVVALAGIWGLVLCTVGLILKSFPARGVLRRGSALRWGGALLLCLIAWIVGMANA